MIRLHQLFGVHAGRDLEFDQVRVRIGRMPDNDVAFSSQLDLDASAFHAEIFWMDGRYSVIDLGSRNGTFVNRERVVGAHPLAVGDEVEFGRGGPRLRVDYIGEAGGYNPPSIAPNAKHSMPLTRRPGDPGSLIGHSERPPGGELIRLYYALFPKRKGGPRVSGHQNLQLTGLGFAFVLFLCLAALVAAYALL